MSSADPLPIPDSLLPSRSTPAHDPPNPGTHTIDQALHLFGTPASVTGFFRSNRGVESDIDDTFTIILQYAGDQRNLLVTIKTAVVTHMKDQLRFFARGTKGSYLKVRHRPFPPCPGHRTDPPSQFGTDPQEARAMASPGQPATDPSFGLEDESIWGTLSTTAPFDEAHQVLDPASGLYVGRYPSLPGWYRGYYENVAAAVRGEAEVFVRPESVRDGLRVIELARQSHVEGRTVSWA